MNVENVDYSKPQTPEKYVCGMCGASGCKLWRPYGAVNVLLRCADCAAKEEKRDISTLDAQGNHRDSGGRVDQIGTYIPAVPIKDDGKVYWSYALVPKDACAWWKKLPNRTP